jgi:hypothetical protein
MLAMPILMPQAKLGCALFCAREVDFALRQESLSATTILERQTSQEW